MDIKDGKKRNKTYKVPSKKEMYTGISEEEYIQNIMNSEMQEEIDYDEGELDKVE